MNSFHGIVVKGEREGRKFGFPTANLEVENDLKAGVYSGYVDFEGKTYRAAITINPKRLGKIVEAHLINFDDDIYGKEITIRVEDLLRDWIIFDNIEEGKAQIKKDINNIIKNL